MKLNIKKRKKKAVENYHENMQSVRRIIKKTSSRKSYIVTFTSGAQFYPSYSNLICKQYSFSNI